VTNALSCFSSPAAGRPCSLHDAPIPFRKKRVRHERHPHNAECLACFRLRHGDGRFAPASFQPSLRLCSTFPFAKPQAEAKLSNVAFLIAVLHSEALCWYPCCQRNRRNENRKLLAKAGSKIPAFL
jgi:hypothetical protein